MADFDDEEPMGRRVPTKGKPVAPGFKPEFDDEERMGGAANQAAPTLRASVDKPASAPGWLDSTKVPGTDNKSVRELLALLGGESAKGAMNTAATPFRMGYEVGRGGDENKPDFENGIAGGMARGFPVAGAYMPETEQDKQFQQQFPGTERAANIAGAALPMLMTGGVGAPAAATSSRFGLEALKGAGKWAGTQGAINSGVNAADTVARDPSALENPAQMGMDAAKNFGLGAFPAVAGRAASPTSRIGQETLEAAMARGTARNTAGKVGEYIGESIAPKFLDNVPLGGRMLHDGITKIGKGLARNQVVTPEHIAQMNALLGAANSGNNRRLQMMDER